MDHRVRDGVFSGFALAIVSLLAISAAAAGAPGFAAPLRLGYAQGDDWEPAVASDGVGNVYMALTHFGGVPGCGGCANPTMLVQVSHDGGKTFGAPRPLTVNGQAQYDPQVKIDSAGTAYVSFMLGKDTVVVASRDHGASWTEPVVANTGLKQGPTDKDGLVVDGANVYLGFSVAQRFFVSVSHDSGRTFAATPMNGNTLGWPLNGGATVAPDGSVYFVWELVHKSGQAQGPQDVAVTASHDRGASWSLSYVAQGVPPGPTCSPCGWDFMGTGSAVAVDASGAVYVAFNAPRYDHGPPVVWLSRSSDGGATWSSPSVVSTAAPASWHVFPSLAAGSSGDVRVAWMDNRTGAYNVWYRSSVDGGQTWASDVQVSQSIAGYGYITTQGFAFPYGDYTTMNLDPGGHVHLAWGEGPNYLGPGNVFYART